ncbi:hypothetical protein ACOMHN_055782 [Nucella lapillus]
MASQTVSKCDPDKTLRYVRNSRDFVLVRRRSGSSSRSRRGRGRLLMKDRKSSRPAPGSSPRDDAAPDSSWGDKARCAGAEWSTAKGKR